ncbi:hypothetical protein HHX38_04010 [Streptomyces sp. PKU-MA01144]|uniref:hypothetical protein n=1 Tax=Streptomyces sp. PKU-MA01144 TaxID=2729138 RepID=UPI001480332E|nr:hypothetical protein [Streptomyces sp. PKU-MA01144]NNJ03307.1 hypothetical protein [Streptomyces sp. PKU-MA01144]
MTEPDEQTLSAAFTRVANAAGWLWSDGPWRSCEGWRGFVEECVEGYEMDYSEYLHDISVRDLLDLALNDEATRRADEFEDFLSAVRRSDDAFRELIARGPVIRPDEPRWWRRALPPHGGEEFVKDVQERLSSPLPAHGRAQAKVEGASRPSRSGKDGVW